MSERRQWREVTGSPEERREAIDKHTLGEAQYYTVLNMTDHVHFDALRRDVWQLVAIAVLALLCAVLALTERHTYTRLEALEARVLEAPK